MTRAWDGALRRVSADDLPPLHRDAVDAETLAGAAGIVRDVERDGEAAVRAHAERLGDIAPGAPLVLDRAALEAALDAVAPETRALLERVAGRIHDFADAQADALDSIDVRVPGGEAGHTVCAVDRAGCYAPGGRFPLPSSVLMTAVTARAAGVGEIWVASPRPAPVTIAAAAVAGADALLAVGGAQAIAALAYGAGAVPPCDVVVGPGNRWVTAAKQLVSGRVRIDMLAGPSELVVFADATADPAVIAADLLAQAEHDDDALPVLVTTDADLADAVDAALVEQLSNLPTAATAACALGNGFTVLVDDADAGVAVCDRLAPEHLQVHLADAEAVVPRLRHYGGLFVGAGAAEVFGDYGIGPNHVLPTGGTGRFTGGLSVFDFLRVRTWLRVPDGGVAASIVEDTAALARLEGLEAHARAALARRTD